MILGELVTPVKFAEPILLDSSNPQVTNLSILYIFLFIVDSSNPQVTTLSIVPTNQPTNNTAHIYIWVKCVKPGSSKAR